MEEEDFCDQESFHLCIVVSLVSKPKISSIKEEGAGKVLAARGDEEKVLLVDIFKN